MSKAYGVRRIDEQPISSAPLLETSLPSDVEKFVHTQFASLYEICQRYAIPIPRPLSEAPIDQAKKVSERNTRAWITRRCIIEIMNATGVSKAEATRRYRENQPRTRVILTPDTAKTVGQIRWVHRVQNVQTKAAVNGEQLSWEEASQRAADLMHESRRQQTG